MRNAPLVLLAEMQSVALLGGPREVARPEEMGGPMAPKIPLYLAKMSAKILLPLRGTETGTITLYSWVWASGMHGGYRLFRPGKGSVHILFLKSESGYLHTVCHYPNCDLEASSKWSGPFVDWWHAGYAKDLNLPERIVATRLKAGFEAIRDARDEFWPSPMELPDFTSPAFFLKQLQFLCRDVVSLPGRRLACSGYEEMKTFW
jgi:hypothetical protein